ncbi:MAG: hypothetical protein PHI18_07525 [bacterium]|nr:hypothetical protein [bacterium]
MTRAGCRWLITMIVLMSAAAGCDLFTTRDAEPPNSARNTWVTPREPRDVLDNVSSAIFERSTVNYMRSFDADDFMFEADPVALSRDPSLADWDYDAENSHARALFSDGVMPADSGLFAVFTVTEETPLGDVTEIHAHYELHAGTALPGAPHEMAGTVYLMLRRGGEDYWQIYRWRDLRTEEQSTWSDLKSLVR